jgi:hypothetical protein
LLGNDRSVFKSSWPQTAPVSKTLKREYEFIKEAKSATCVAASKAKKEETHATLFVVSTMPDWKIACLRWMRGLYDKENKLPDNLIALLKARHATCSLDRLAQQSTGNEQHGCAVLRVQSGVGRHTRLCRSGYHHSLS